MKKNRRMSMRKRLGLLTALLTLVMCVSTVLIGFNTYHDTVEEHYESLGRSLAETVAGFIDGDTIPQYLGTRPADAAYDKTLQSLCTACACREVEFMYVLRPADHGFHVVYNSTNVGAARTLGEYAPWSSDLVPLALTLQAGRQVETLVIVEDGRRLMAIFEPVYASDGGVAGYVAIALSMASMSEDWMIFLFQLIAVNMMIGALFIVLALMVMNGAFVRPMKALVRATDDFLSGAGRKSQKWSSIEALQVSTGDELEHLANSLKAMERRTREYITHLDAANRKAETDALTGLYNRAALEQRVAEALFGEGNAGALNAFMIIDIDYFKQVNDSFGHMAGDDVLKACAGAMREVFRSSDIMARIGGDEFAVFCANVGSLEIVLKKAGQLNKWWRTITLPSGEQLTASIGVALAPQNGTSYKALYRSADAALYACKAQGRDGFVVAE